MFTTIVTASLKNRRIAIVFNVRFFQSVESFDKNSHFLCWIGVDCLLSFVAFLEKILFNILFVSFVG